MCYFIIYIYLLTSKKIVVILFECFLFPGTVLNLSLKIIINSFNSNKWYVLLLSSFYSG